MNACPHTEGKITVLKRTKFVQNIRHDEVKTRKQTTKYGVIYTVRTHRREEWGGKEPIPAYKAFIVKGTLVYKGKGGQSCRCEWPISWITEMKYTRLFIRNLDRQLVLKVS